MRLAGLQAEGGDDEPESLGALTLGSVWRGAGSWPWGVGARAGR